MKICDKGLNFFQINNDNGDCRICAWTKDCYVGNLVDSTFEEVWNGIRAESMRKRLITHDYSKCIIDDCPYLGKNEIENHLLEIDELPMYPETISLSYDNVCNYNCSTCDIHERYAAADKTEMAKRFDKIETELKKVLPYVKEISANGQGEVFASERIMKMLADWKPLSPANECRVSIETNGSLFDEKNWSKISNLGQYDLMVSVTIMSFDEYTYQQLSGVKYPISRIENNLRFIKKLREEGIINYLELATVVQERNFRQLPEFTRRCIEEFGADEVRLRYFIPWHKKSPEIEWFADVRNPYHPYNDEFKEIMKDPIFRHPKVNDWSGGRGSLLGEHPYKKNLFSIQNKLTIADKKIAIQHKYIENYEKFCQQITDHISKDKEIVIYGIGEIGKLLIKTMKDNYKICAILDRYSSLNEYEGIKVLKLDEFDETSNDYIMIITPIGNTEEIIEKLKEYGIVVTRYFSAEQLLLCEE